MKGNRRFLATTVGALTLIVVLPSAAVAQATSTGAILAAHEGVSTAPRFVAYHNLTPAQQTERFDTLRGQGYRPITVSVSTDLSGRTRYAGMWSVSGRAMGGDLPWAMYHDMSADGYQRRFDQLAAQGYQPAVVSATGSGERARFAAIFVKNPGFRYVAKHGITPAELLRMSGTARQDGLMLSSVDTYGTASAPRYVAVWSANPGRVSWHVSVSLTQEGHDAEFRKNVAKGFRPTTVAVSATGRYTTVWRDDKPGAWHSYIGMTAAGYQSRFDDLKAKGFYPIHINAETGRYAAIWTK
ncbi:hypothetical protein [Nonomuraea cavernae]|uniref:Uncharacterized protein n=1 Tax=Nonomuraea cavernae TaxID=2045107 RepID=A0A918DQZ5_9ACTN|nr:hypothetical protein [Nonomuraea cavernae]MCA2185632.1 hypothetical protein [Nonomuraea cavernae]GGO78110.1 hypothetical protein GCM10012289_59350 [Nonomuraea cavernae]